MLRNRTEATKAQARNTYLALPVLGRPDGIRICEFHKPCNEVGKGCREPPKTSPASYRTGSTQLTTLWRQGRCGILAR